LKQRTQLLSAKPKRPSWRRLQRLHRRGRAPLGDVQTRPGEDIASVIRLYAMVGRMRLISDRAVTDAAKQVEDTIIKTYLRPNRSFQEFVDYAHKGGMELLTQFGEAARKDLAARANAERWNASADRQDIVQIVEVGLGAGVGDRRHESVEDVCDGARDCVAFGKRSVVGLVLEGTVAVELELVENVIGRGWAVRRFEFGVVVVGRHGRSFAGSAAHIAAFMAITWRRAERTCTRSEAKGRSASGGWRSPAILFRAANARRAGGK
jgi:hypothetical protein